MPCFWLFGQIVSSFTCIFAFYVVLVFSLRALLGEKVWQHASFWFYVSMFMYNVVMFPVFMQWDDWCQYVCYAYLPAHGAARTTIIVFIFYKLELFNPERVLRDSEAKMKWIEKISRFIVCIYILLTTIRFISRFWSTCYELDEPAGCVAEKDPVIFFGNVPDMSLTFIEIVLWFRLVKAWKSLHSEHEFAGQNNWLENEISSRMWWYVVTSFVTLTTNLILYTALLVVGILYILDRLNPEKEHSMCIWTLYLNVGVVNVTINMVMVTLCFPFRSINVYFLLRAFCFESRRFPITDEPSLELSPEQLREFAELERARLELAKKNALLNESHKKKVLRVLKKDLMPGQRLIQRSWEKNPVTGRVRYLPTPSDSESKSEEEDSSSGVMLIIPEDFDAKRKQKSLDFIE